MLVVPLRAGLAKGSYTVRWRVISNDGHLISGVVAFGIGTKPVATLTAGGTALPPGRCSCGCCCWAACSPPAVPR